MKNILKARKGGFTLVELLIVIMIIAILAGMMMLATGTATDTAEATRIINDLRAGKAAGILIFMEENLNWNWATTANAANAEPSFDRHMDRPLFSAGVYDLDFQTANVDTGGTTPESKVLVGYTITPAASFTDGIKRKLAGNAERVGLYNATGGLYTNEDTVYMILH